ncbi:hypothetical protein D3C84_899000 [compost metagenome]
MLSVCFDAYVVTIGVALPEGAQGRSVWHAMGQAATGGGVGLVTGLFNPVSRSGIQPDDGGNGTDDSALPGFEAHDAHLFQPAQVLVKA